MDCDATCPVRAGKMHKKAYHKSDNTCVSALRITAKKQPERAVSDQQMAFDGQIGIVKLGIQDTITKEVGVDPQPLIV